MTKEQLIKELETYYTQVRDELSLTSDQEFNDGWNAGFREALKLVKETK
jgi:hypothetical protein